MILKTFRFFWKVQVFIYQWILDKNICTQSLWPFRFLNYFKIRKPRPQTGFSRLSDKSVKSWKKDRNMQPPSLFGDVFHCLDWAGDCGASWMSIDTHPGTIHGYWLVFHGYSWSMSSAKHLLVNLEKSSLGSKGVCLSAFNDRFKTMENRSFAHTFSLILQS